MRRLGWALVALAGCGGAAHSSAPADLLAPSLPTALIASWQAGGGADVITLDGSGAYSEVIVTPNVFGATGDEAGCTQTQSWGGAAWSATAATLTVTRGARYLLTVAVSGCANPHYDSPDGPSTAEPAFSLPLVSDAYTVSPKTAGAPATLTFRGQSWQAVTP